MSLEIIEVEQGSEEWHNLRAKYPRTASRTSTVLGISPFSNKEKLAQEIKFGIKPFYSSAMKQGNDLEDTVREMANEHFNDVFMPAVGVNGSFLASLDGINYTEDTIIEIKVSKHTYNDVLNGNIPSHYEWQIRHQMEVFDNVVSGYLIAYSPSEKKIAVSDAIKRKPDDFFTLVNAWDEFDDFMETYELPENEVVEDEDAILLANELYEINLKKKELESREKEIKSKLESFSKSEKVSIGNLTMSKQKGRVSYDYKKMISDLDVKDDFVEKYKKQAKDSIVFRFK